MGARSVRFWRQSGQTWAISGTSTSVNLTSFDFSQSLNWRLTPIRPSAVPQAIQSRRICELALLSRFGKFFGRMDASSAGWPPRPPGAPGPPAGGDPAAGGGPPAGGVPAPLPGPPLAPGHITYAPLKEPIQANLSR